MKLFCECGKEILKIDKFNLKYVELNEFPVCQNCGRKGNENKALENGD